MSDRKRKEFSKITKSLLYARSKGFCEHCHLPLKGVEYHHILECELGGDGSFNNGLCVCIPCHKYLSKTQSIPRISKSNRILAKRMNITRKKRSWGYGKNDRLKKKLNGQVVIR